MILTELQGLTLSTPSQVISLMFRVKMSGRSLCFNLIITPKPLIRGVPLRARVFISDLSIIYCQPSSVKMLILTRSGDRGGPGGRGIMYAISLWLMASLTIFSGRPCFDWLEMLRRWWWAGIYDITFHPLSLSLVPHTNIFMIQIHTTIFGH